MPIALFMHGYLGSYVESISIPPTSRDPDDDAVLACALAAQADLIVSGDQDLLVLEQFKGIPIVTAADALILTEHC